MSTIPFESVYGCYFGLMFSTRTRFLLKQLVRICACIMFARARVGEGTDFQQFERARVWCLFTHIGQVVLLAALKTADGSAVGVANHAVAMLKAPLYAAA